MLFFSYKAKQSRRIIKTGLAIKASFLFVLTVIFTTLVGCSKNETLTTMDMMGETMGTTYSVSVVSPPDHLSKAVLQENIDALLQSVNQQMSTYIDDSDIIFFNQLSNNQPYKIKPAFLEVILLSQEISALTNGGFDITIGPLVELWGFGKKEEQAVPSDSDIADAMSRVGWQYLVVDEKQSTITKKRSIWLDVSAVAKGFAVDKVVALLQQQGAKNFLVEIGGEMRVKGHNRRQQPWRIGIEIPSLLKKQAQQLVHLSDSAIATSGDYRNYFEENGQRFSHTIDPATGKPVRHNIASVSVISDSAAKADALATALNVLGEEAAIALAEKEKLAAYFIFYDDSQAEGSNGYRIVYTDSFKQFIQ